MRTPSLRLILWYSISLGLVTSLAVVALVYCLGRGAPETSRGRDSPVGNDIQIQKGSAATQYPPLDLEGASQTEISPTPNGILLRVRPSDQGLVPRPGGEPVSQSLFGNELAGSSSNGEPIPWQMAGTVVTTSDGSLPTRGGVAQRGVIDLQNLLEGAGGLTLAMIAIVLLGCSVAGLILALRAERSLRRVTQAIREFAVSETSQVVPEEGPGEVRTLARAFNSLVERTRNQEEARRQLLANLTHELGRPLGALCSAVQALEGGADQDPELRRQLLEGMQNELERLQRLVGDLGELHNGALGSLELNRATVPLSVWLPQVLAPWREAAQSRRLQWQCSIDPDLPSIEADPDRLAQAVGNLLSNAIKYTPAGGTIGVSVRADDGILSISVSDTGPGIPAHEQDRIFAPFYRARSDRRFPQGMGLGLTIARDVVQAHRGTLEVQSGLRRGSCFTIHLPLN